MEWINCFLTNYLLYFYIINPNTYIDIEAIVLNPNTYFTY